MSWINEIDISESRGKLNKLYKKIVRERGKVANIMRIHSLNPDSMEAHMNLYLTLMFKKSGLSRPERELIAVVVSTTNKCAYCINHHSVALNNYWNDENIIEQLKKDYRSLQLSKKTMKKLNYAVKLTKTPNKIVKDDIEGLRKVGFTDEDILNINLIVSYFNFVNRIALGLGVDFTEEEMHGYKV